MDLHNVTHSLLWGPNDDLTVRRSQHLDQAFLDGLEDARTASTGRAGEFHQVASIPTAVVELWLRQGFDVYREPVKAIIRRLQSEDLNCFITTTKRV